MVLVVDDDANNDQIDGFVVEFYCIVTDDLAED